MSLGRQSRSHDTSAPAPSQVQSAKGVSPAEAPRRTTIDQHRTIHHRAAHRIDRAAMVSSVVATTSKATLAPKCCSARTATTPSAGQGARTSHVRGEGQRWAKGRAGADVAPDFDASQGDTKDNTIL